MNEVIDYNALNWVRQELDKVLRQARSFLDEYAGNRSDTACLQVCAKNLHQARGPLRMVGLRGADQLASEMEEVIADLLHGTLEDAERALEVLMQAFLQLPDYLSRLHSGRTDNPAVLLPVINSLREVRSVPVLDESSVFAPDLVVTVPPEVFGKRKAVPDREIQARARAARLKFQTGLLDWYRGNDGNTGLQVLHSVLRQMLQDAGRESVARLWWVAGAIIEAIIEGDMPENGGNKQLYGRVDRQIKRLVDVGESVFDDPLTDELMKSMLFSIANTESTLECIQSIKSTYNLDGAPGDATDSAVAGDSLAGCSEELLQTVALTASEDIDRIKDRLDIFTRGKRDNPDSLLPVAEELHALGNMLDMVGIDRLGHAVVEQAGLIHGVATGDGDLDKSAFTAMANLLVAVEDAVHNLGESETAGNVGAGRLFLRKGMEAVIREAVADMARAKEAIVEFIRVPGNPETLNEVPGMLARVRGSLQLSGQERAAVAVDRIGQFIGGELVENRLAVNDSQLELLADAVCSVEYFIEESGEDHDQGNRVLGIAEESLAALGYPCPALSPEDEQTVYGRDELPGYLGSIETEVITEALPAKPADSLEIPVITELQVIDKDADEEILAIFIEEADEVLAQLGEQLPAWSAAAGEPATLEAVQRGLHTIKGSGRMVGALALGEFAWAFENLIIRVIDGTVKPDDALQELVGQSVAAMTQLLEQVRDSDTTLQADVNEMVRQAMILAHPGAQPGDSPCEAAIAVVTNPQADAFQPEVQTSLFGMPVLAEDADPEILEIFIEEAAEEIASLTENIPLWINQPDNPGILACIQRSLHTLKGSGRMAGALVMGEFSWTLENLVNRMTEGELNAGKDVFVLLEQVPGALEQLFEQLRNGTALDMDFEGLAGLAGALIRGGAVMPETPDDVVPDELPEDEPEAPVEELASEDVSGEDEELLDVFIKESGEHLLAIEDFLGANQSPCTVTESLYRSLHTISGSANSARVRSISKLAVGLYDYFDGLYQGKNLAGDDALAVLGDCAAEINRLIRQLPDMSIDEEVQAGLCERIEALPRNGVKLPEPSAQDPYASVDSELLDVFIEEASEIIDAGEGVLRAWSEDPASQDLMVEFQRQLHTLKGGARMVDIIPIGDLSHTLESLLARVAEGQIEATPDFFVLLHDSYDHLAEMLEHVKSRELPADAGELKTAIEDMGQEKAKPGTGQEADMGEADSVRDAEQGSPQAEDGVASVTDEDQHDPDFEAEKEQVAEPEPEGDAVSASIDDAALALETSDNPVEEVHVESVDILPEPVKLKKMNERPPGFEQRKRPRVRSEQVRVRAELLDNMVSHAGEVNIYRARMEQQISDYRYNLGELGQTIGRLREQLRQVEIETEAHILFRYEQESESVDRDFDPLEMDRYSNLQQLSRSLSESIGDLCSIQELMENTTRQSETLLLQQSRVGTDLQDGLLRTRMIPFAGIAPRLRRILRQSARQLGKKVELGLEGADGEMDRTVIDRITAPLEHMLRNAIAHGIEDPETRKKAGKPPAGTITIGFEREGSEIVLRIEDDGAGLDIDAIRARAIKRNLLDADADLPDSDIMQFVLQTGFSTAAEVTQISGRGVGMDVVNGEVKQLGGSLHISSVAGEGAVFSVRLPYTLASNQALLVKAGEETFCIPLGSIEGISRIPPGQLAEYYQEEGSMLGYAGNRYQLKHLGSLLGCGGMEKGMQQAQVPVLLTRLGDKRVAFQLESILGSREIVIKPLGAQLKHVDGVSGATILGDGRVVLILDVMSLSRMQGQVTVPDLTVAQAGDERLHVMVVDDSITVRKVTTRLLERNGFRVLSAKDGVDAMGLLQESVPDIMLLDIEMPRMDGFELATHMRNDERLKHVPVIMITSRTGTKHRERAKQIGVSSYLGKPYQENELLESIHSLIDVRKAEECA